MKRLLCILLCLRGLLLAAPALAQQGEVKPDVRIVRTVRITGTLPKDGAEGLRRFLDINPGDAWEGPLQSRVVRDLEALGYQADADFGPAGDLLLTVKPYRVVRRIFVRGNWPFFENEVLSNLSWRPRDRLPDGDRLAAEMRKQEGDVAGYLHRAGYYDATVEISLEWDEKYPEQVDVRVQLHLNSGFFRLRYSTGTVESHGFKLLDKNAVASHFQHCCLWFGRTGAEKINNDFKRLLDYYHDKHYAGVRLTQREFHPDHKKRQVNIAVTIEERKRIEIFFPGRKSLSEKELLSAVTIFRDSYYSQNELDESAREIFRRYQANGFFEARVGWKWRSRDTDPLQVEFQIQEGPELRVREVRFVNVSGGMPFFKPAKLQEEVRTRPYPRLGLIGLGEGGYVTSIQLQQDVERLEAYYHGQGFPFARVQADVARTQAAQDSASLLGLSSALSGNEDSADLYVRFRIDEGPRQTVGQLEVVFQGAHDLTEAHVRKVLKLQAGMPYTQVAQEEDRTRLGRLFGAHGHPYAKIHDVSVWDKGHVRISIRWVLMQGDLVHFGPILVRGNFITRENVIRKALHFREGDTYSGDKIHEAEQNLIQRQLFSFVRITPNPGQSAQYILEAREAGWSLLRKVVPVLVEVGERYDNSGEISANFGVSTDNVVFGSASYIWPNLAGTGIEVEVRGELGVRIQSLLVRLADPQFLSLSWRLDLRGFWRNEITYSLGPVTTYGANAELTHFVTNIDQEGRRLPPTLKFFTRLEFTISQILVPLSRAEGTADFGQVGDETQQLKLTVGVVWDKRVGLDAPAFRRLGQPPPVDPLLPISGFLLKAQATGAVCCSFKPGSFDAQDSYLSFIGQAVGLRPFGPELPEQDGWIYGMRRFNFRANLQFNYGVPLLRSALPVVERFYAGGDTATRGYDTDALKAEVVRSPVGPLPGEAAYRIVPQGGNIRLLSQLEWEFAIRPSVLGFPWFGALFVDTGAVFNSFRELTWNDVRFSIGVSFFRLLTRFGALSAEYAYPLTLPGQDPLFQTEHWKRDPWYTHFPGRFHFNWGMPIAR